MKTEELMARLPEIEDMVAFDEEEVDSYPISFEAIRAFCKAVRELAAEVERLRAGEKESGEAIIEFFRLEQEQKREIHRLKAENERLRDWIERADGFDIGGGYRIGKHADNTGWSVWDRNDDLALLLHAETPDAALQAWQEKAGA